MSYFIYDNQIFRNYGFLEKTILNESCKVSKEMSDDTTHLTFSVLVKVVLLVTFYFLNGIYDFFDINRFL